jgi:hypothetical protein
MNLTKYSRNRIIKTFQNWQVPRDFADPMYNYLVHGYSPGSCFIGVLANDFNAAIRSSHPANTVEAFKALAGWIQDTVPSVAHGNYKALAYWIGLTNEERRAILEQEHLIYTKEEEVMLVLAGEPAHEPTLY